MKGDVVKNPPPKLEKGIKTIYNMIIIALLFDNVNGTLKYRLFPYVSIL